MKKGFFVTIEGCEGSGKSTQSVLLYDYFKKSKFSAVHTREPGGTVMAETIRKLLLNPKNRIAPLAELLLYEAARAQHIQEVILPSLKAGKIVICDRYTDATLAYQGYGRGINLETIKKLNDIATQNLTPDLTIYLDIPVQEGLIKARTLKKDSFVLGGDRLERESVSFHKRVRRGYLLLAKIDPKRIKVIRTQKTAKETHKKIVDVVEKLLHSSIF